MIESSISAGISFETSQVTLSNTTFIYGAVHDMPAFSASRPRPNKHAEREAWEASWARDLESYYNPDQPLHRHAHLASSASKDALAFNAEPQCVLEDDRCARQVCQYDIDLARHLHPLAWHVFQQGWRALSDERRKELVLEGLYRASCMSEESRSMTPEMTLKNLTKDNGSEVLRLLFHWTNRPHLTHATHLEPVYVPNRMVDYLLSLSDEEAKILGAKASMRMMRIGRMEFMCLALCNIYRAYVSTVTTVCAFGCSTRVTMVLAWGRAFA